MGVNDVNDYAKPDLAHYRPLAFFGINIEQDEENISGWVRWCKQQGFRGFNIIVGSDCQGRAHEAWIEKLLTAYEIAFKTAREEGLEVWIFDDWGYPSGTAGGLVCTNPDYRLKRLDNAVDMSLEPGQSITIEVPSRYVAASILPAKGPAEPLDLKPGETFTYKSEKACRLVIIGWNYDPHQAKSSCKSYPGDPAMSVIDMLNPEATRRFIEVMHTMYYQRFSEYMGTVVKGFFYDEPFVPYEFPWTDKLPQVFWERKGYDLLEILPELLVRIHNARGPLQKYADDFFDVWTDMAAENFYGEMSKWCSRQGLELSGHLDLDHHLNTMSTISGHFYKNLQHNHRPAVDVIWAQIAPGEFSDFPRYAGSIKYLLGKQRAVSETFAGMGFGLSGDLMRYITDHQVIRGIDDFHLMYSSNRPPAHEASPQMPHHMLQKPFGPLIYKRMATAAALSNMGRPANTVAVYLPAYDFNRAQLGLRNVGITNAQQLPWEWVNQIAEYLTYAPRDFCYLWQEALLELDVDHGGLVTKGGNVIKTIIVPPDTTFTPEATEKLQKFSASGGQVIAVFKPLWSLGGQAVMCNEVTDLTTYIPAEIEVDSPGKISLLTRKLGNQTLYMLLNELNQPVSANIEFMLPGAVFEINMADSQLSSVPLQGRKVVLNFGPMQLRTVLVDQGGQIKLADPPLNADVAPVFPKNWFLTLPGGEVRHLSGETFPDWAELGYPGYSGSLEYTAEFDWTGGQRALLRADGLYSHAQVFIDGQEVGRMAYRPYKLEITGLDKGRHKLAMVVYNTDANSMCGTLEIEKERYHGRFAHLAHYDRRRLTSGLLQPVSFGELK